MPPTPRPYPAYKPTGVEWLGDVPGHWGVLRLRTVADMRVSNVDKHTNDDELPVRLCNYVDVYYNDRITQAIPFMAATASPDEVERFRLQRGDVLITKDSETWDDIAVPALVVDAADDLLCGYHLAILRPKESLLGSYLARALQSNAVAYQFHVEAKGVTRFGLTHTGIQSAQIPLPPLPEQAAIVRYLDHADRRIRRYIDGKERLIALLEEEKQAIINQAVTRGLDPNVPLKPSGVEWLGDVPAHWELRRLGASIAKAVTGIWGDDPDGIDDLPCVRVADFDRAKHRVRLHDPTMRAVTPTERIRRVLKRGDLLFEKSGGGDRQPVGVVVLYDHDLEAVCSNFISKLTPSDGHDPEFLTYLHSDLYAVGVNNAAIKQTTGIQNIDAAAYLAELVAFPPLSEQVQIVAYLSTAVGNVDTAIAAARRQIELLREYRTRLISDVVTGKLDVREAAANLPDESDE